MPSPQGPNSPGTASSSFWATPNNTFSSDNSYSTRSVSGASSTGILEVSNFGFSIPSGAVIYGIIIEIERKASNTTGSPRDAAIRLKKTAGTAVGDELASGSTWPTSDAYATYGTSTTLHGTTWTDAEINAITFGVMISGQRNAGKGSTTFSVDHVRITVHYTEGDGGATAHKPVIVSQAINRASRW